MTRATLAIVAAFSAIVSTAETSRTATENWTRNRIAEATNATLQAAKDYADSRGGGGITAQDATNAATAVVERDVPSWAKQAQPPAEADPTVPAWAKSPTPPEEMMANALVWTNNEVKTKDGGKTIGASDVGAYSKTQSDERYMIPDSKGYLDYTLHKSIYFTNGGGLYVTAANPDKQIAIRQGGYIDGVGLAKTSDGGRSWKEYNLPDHGGTLALTDDITAAIDHTSEHFSNEVLSVMVNGLSTNITEEVYIAATNACANLGLDPDLIPQGGTIGTVGGLLLALAAAVALLRKRTQLIDNDGFATDQFAAEILGKQVAINALKIPLEAKTDSFVAEDGHAYAVTMTGTVTITMPTTTTGKAAIFQARFSAAAQQSVEFSTAALVKFDGTDCGIVKAGKDALLSAMWNGSAWDLVWKNEA